VTERAHINRQFHIEFHAAILWILTIRNNYFIDDATCIIEPAKKAKKNIVCLRGERKVINPSKEAQQGIPANSQNAA
jgi:hypothetical protein